MKHPVFPGGDQSRSRLCAGARGAADAYNLLGVYDLCLGMRHCPEPARRP